MAWHELYRKVKKINGGGNANVFLVERKSDKQLLALKELKFIRGKLYKERKARFREEVRIMNENHRSIDGIMPILQFSTKEYWYSMPIAQSIMEHLSPSHNRLQNCISGIVQISQTLSELHKKGISHRDIKPKNILYFSNRFFLADFGLVDFPDNLNDLTRDNKPLGAIFTIAPEMKRDPKHADGTKADVYSLAKTLWMLITKDEKGFDGTYNYLDRSHGLSFIEEFKSIHLAELEDLLTSSTQNDPHARPDIVEFGNQLTRYVQILNDWQQAQLSDWKALEKRLFPSVSPSSATWNTPHKIVEALNIIGSIPAYNHMMLSDGGGVDFASAEIAPEKDCIYITTSPGSTLLVRPRALLYESFDDDYQWNYFILELDQLAAQFGDTKENYEFLVEDTPGHYVSALYEQYKVYDYDKGTPLPDGYKVVNRYLRGRFLIVFKFSPYNGINNAYDGRHGQCSLEDFKDYIDTLRNLYNSLMQQFIAEYPDQMEQKNMWSQCILRLDEFEKNPFEKTAPLFELPKARTPQENEVFETISSQYLTWPFASLLGHQQSNSKIKFYFSLYFSAAIDHFKEYLAQTGIFLCRDGFLKEKGFDDLDDVYFIYNRQDALAFKSQCETMIEGIFKAGGVNHKSFIMPVIMIHLVQIEKPTHLFTKDEIRNEIQKADDRVHNRLVIDEDGQAHVIRDHKMTAFTYPVRHEPWHAGGVFVGKYSSLSYLDDDYISSLEGWLKYLQLKKAIYVEYVSRKMSEEELISEIKQYY